MKHKAKLLFISLAFLSAFPALLWAQGPSRSGFPSQPAQALRAFPCGGDVLFDEPFSGNTIPADWTVLDLDGQQPFEAIKNPPVSAKAGWQSHVDFNNPHNRLLISPSWYEDSTVRSDDWLISPRISLGSNPCLSWYAYSQDKYFPESYEVRISLTSPTPDSAGFLANPPVMVVAGEANEFTYRSVGLAEYANQEVYIAFRHTSKDKFVLALDDIRVSEVKKVDLMTFDLITPVGGVGEELPIKGAILNLGSDTLDIDSTLQIFYSINGGLPLSMVVRDTMSLAPNDSIQFTHDSIWVPTEEAVYLLCVWASGFPDENISNDTACIWVGVGRFVGLEQEDPLMKVEIFPNPASERLNIHFPPQQSPVHFRLYDLMGRQHLPTYMVPAGQAQLQLRVGHLPEGLYIMHIEQDGRILGRHKIWIH